MSESYPVEEHNRETSATCGSKSAVERLVMAYPALSIRQPWAWMILHGGKDIENRCWPTKFRGKVLIHAAKGMTMDEWSDAWGFAHGSGAGPKALDANVTAKNIDRGGIVGIAEIVDCVTRSDSRWFVGPYGFVLRNVETLPFYPCKGALGFFRLRP